MAASKLRSLGDTPVPPTLAQDLARVETLPASARERFWQVLGPILEEPIRSDIEKHLDAFVRAHQASAEDVAKSLKAARYLVREASIRSLDLPEVLADLADLGLGEGAVARVIAAGYEVARNRLREESATRLLLDHGKTVSTIAWRVDEVVASSKEAITPVTIGVMTMVVRSGGSTENITLQFTESSAKDLEAFARAILEKKAPVPESPRSE